MRSDRPLIAAILCLAGGLALILIYCTGTSSLSAAYPIASSSLHIELTATGAAELGGIALTFLGLLLLVWAFLAAIVSQVIPARDRDRHYDRDRRYEARDRHYEAVGGATKNKERFVD